MPIKIDMPDTGDVLAYSPQQAARVVGRSHSRIKLAVRRKELMARKDGRATLLERAELMRWVAALPTVGRAPEQEAASVAVKGNTRPTPPRARSLTVAENNRR
jgi:excisionase family DNA binding protein